MRQRVRAGLYVNTTPVQEKKRAALACHASQKDWLDVSQGMNSYVTSMDEMSRAVGDLSGQFEYAEGWRRHLHLGFSGREIDPLAREMGAESLIDAIYEASLETPI
jgi:LmbE family N-acetylglucosaminyl deacetylase